MTNLFNNMTTEQLQDIRHNLELECDKLKRLFTYKDSNGIYKTVTIIPTESAGQFKIKQRMIHDINNILSARAVEYYSDLACYSF